SCSTEWCNTSCITLGRSPSSRRPVCKNESGRETQIGVGRVRGYNSAVGNRPSRTPLSADNIVNVAVIGVGAFGRNHARVYKQLEQQGEAVRLLGVVDRDVTRADAVARESGCRSFGSLDQLITTHSEVQAASVTVPTVHHLEVASMLM